jgi:hypothetical protein
MRSRTLAIVLACSAAGCDGTVQLGSNEGDSSARGDSSGNPADSSGDGGAIMAALTPGGNDDAGSCVRACSATPGPSTPLTTNAELLGSWLVCSGNLGTYPPKTVGIEFAASAAYYLVLGPSGEPMRGTGFEYQATWERCSSYVILTMGSHTAIYQPVLSECPRQVWMTFVTGDIACGGHSGD